MADIPKYTLLLIILVVFASDFIFLNFSKPLTEPGLNLIERDNTILLRASVLMFFPVELFHDKYSRV